MQATTATRVRIAVLSVLALGAVVVGVALTSPAPGAASAPRPDPAATQAKLDRIADRAPDSVTGWYVDPGAGQLVVETVDVRRAESFVAEAGAQDDDVRIVGVDQKPRPFGPGS